MRHLGILFLLVAVVLFFLPALAFAGEEAKSEKEKVGETKAAETPKPAEEVTAKEAESKAEAEEPEEAGPKKVALNLKNVNIDKVIKFLSDITDKIVIKHKDAKAQITIVSPREVTHEEAMRLICEALRLENVVVVERDKMIWLLPAAKLSEIDFDLLLPEERGPAVGIVRKVISIRFADVAELEKVIKPLLSKDALVVDPISRKIIVTDTVVRVANLEKVLAQLDVLEVEDRQVQIFPLKYADAVELAPILKAVLSAPEQKPSGKKPPGKKPSTPSKPSAAKAVEVLPYKAANWLVVVAPEGQIAKAKKLIDQLDKERPEDLKLRVIVVKYAEATDLASQLSRLFRKRHTKRVRDTVEITGDDRSNTLLVLSSEQNYEVMERVVKELDTEESLKMTFKTYPLEHADADDIADHLNDLYSGLQQPRSFWDMYYGRGRRKEETRFVAERRSNSVIAIAPPNEIEKIAALIEKLDVPLDPEQVAPRIYRLKYSDAKELTEVLNEIFGVEDTSRTGGYAFYQYRSTSGKQEVGRLYGKVRFVANTATNSILVVTNNKENFPIIRKTIEELDSISPEAANTMVVPLKNANAKDLAEQLNALFAMTGIRAPEKKEGEEPRSFYSWFYGSPQKKEERAISNLIGQVRVVPIDRINAVIVTTVTQNFPTIRRLIEDLDVESPKVYVRVRLIEIIRTETRRVGARWSSEASVFESDDFDNGLQSEFGFTWTDIHRDGTISAGVDINLLIQFLQRTFDIRILSEPTLAMDNNYPATLFVGAQIPFITGTTVTPEGGRSETFDYKDAGTKLIITPNINEDNKVVMKVTLEATQVRPGVIILGGAVLDTRTFETELAVESGQTMVIGGIMREEESEVIRRVPILGYIPIINLLFKKKDTTHETTELVAFITASVLRTPRDDADVSRRVGKQLRNIEGWHPLPVDDETQKEQE